MRALPRYHTLTPLPAHPPMLYLSTVSLCHCSTPHFLPPAAFPTTTRHCPTYGLLLDACSVSSPGKHTCSLLVDSAGRLVPTMTHAYMDMGWGQVGWEVGEMNLPGVEPPPLWRRGGTLHTFAGSTPPGSHGRMPVGRNWTHAIHSTWIGQFTCLPTYHLPCPTTYWTSQARALATPVDQRFSLHLRSLARR